MAIFKASSGAERRGVTSGADGRLEVNFLEDAMTLRLGRVTHCEVGSREVAQRPATGSTEDAEVVLEE